MKVAYVNFVKGDITTLRLHYYFALTLLMRITYIMLNAMWLYVEFFMIVL